MSSPKKVELVIRNSTTDEEEVLANTLKQVMDLIPAGYHLQIEDMSGHTGLNLYREESRNIRIRVATLTSNKKLRR